MPVKSCEDFTGQALQNRVPVNNRVVVNTPVKRMLKIKPLSIRVYGVVNRFGLAILILTYITYSNIINNLHRSFSKMSEPVDCPTSQLVVNGTFDADADWAKEQWTIGGGTANISWLIPPVVKRIRQNIAIVAGGQYVVKFDITVANFVGADALFIYMNGGPKGAGYNTVDSHTRCVLSDDGSTEFGFFVSTAPTGVGNCSVDNVRVYSLEEYLACQYNLLPSEDVVSDFWDLADPDVMIKYHGDFARSNIELKIDTDLIV